MSKPIFNVFFLLSFFVLANCTNPDDNNMVTIELDANWYFSKQSDSVWYPAKVPGTVHTDLLNNKLIDDPFYRLNEHDLQWVDKENWEYKTLFKVEASFLKKQEVELQFNGLDTYAKIYLNDKLIKETDNMFRTYNVNCKAELESGENELRIVFESPINKGVEKYDALDYSIPVSNNDLAELGQVEGGKRVSIFSRKAGYHFGWDWGPRLTTSGIWRSIQLKAWDGFKTEDVFIEQLSIGDTCDLQANISVTSKSKADKVSAKVLVNGFEVKSNSYELQAGLNTIKVPFEITEPELWWPNGFGDQHLYNIDVIVGIDNKVQTVSKRIGLRTVELITEPDSMGTSFYFKVNGHPLFMKGTNYIPQDVFLPRVDTQHYEHILQSAKNANMNMVRVWGGGIYENNLFYDLCDELGLLVWQDFMFACAMFPGDTAFLENVRYEAVDNVKRLRQHPSVALWCGNNEILSAWENWGWKNNETKMQGQEVADKIWQAYHNIFHEILPQVVEQYDSSRRYWPSSPGAAFGEKEERNRGDMHYWGVWWGKEPFANYETVMPRFMSEFGFQSFPELNTVKRYATPDDYDIFSEVMKSHQRSTIGNGTIKEYMYRHYKKPKDFESFLYVSQVLQADGIGFGIEAQRRNRLRCMGSLYWQLNDCWPVASWSGIDYYGKWKALHYKIKRVFEPLIITASDKGKSLSVMAVSDLLYNFEGKVNYKLMTLKGNVLKSWENSIIVPANSASKVEQLDKQDLFKGRPFNELILVIELSKIGSPIYREIVFFDKFKNINFPNPEISFTVLDKSNVFVVELAARNMARQVFISTPYLGNFSDNYFDMLPGESKTIEIIKPEKVNLDEFRQKLKVQSLYDAF